MIAHDIHGHELLRLVGDAETPFTRPTLEARVLEMWGPDVRFHTCSADGLRFEDLYAFLTARGKIVVAPDGALSIDVGEMCSSGD